jgi:IS30 family transposase
MNLLTLEQRYTIGILLEQNYKKTKIVVSINRDKSIITSDLKHNSDLRSGKYSSEFLKENIINTHYNSLKT